jgi:hypothetical protein
MGSEFAISDVKYVRHKKGGEQSVYQLSDMDMSASVRYYFYVHNERGWLIMSEEESAGVTAYRYAVGWSDPDTAWTGRAGLSYAKWHDLGEKI